MSGHQVSAEGDPGVVFALVFAQRTHESNSLMSSMTRDAARRKAAGQGMAFIG
jgi:hypothetical protein